MFHPPLFKDSGAYCDEGIHEILVEWCGYNGDTDNLLPSI